MEQIVSNTAQVKVNNKELIKQALIRLQQGSKIRVAHETGLSVATCNSLLNELSASGEILETDADVKKNGAGRPSKTYRINERFFLGCCLSFHLDGPSKYLQYSIIDLLGNAIESDTILHTSIDYSVIKALLNGLVEKYEQLRIVSIGIPGVVNKNQEIESCDIQELTGLSLRDAIRKDFGLAVSVDNDMNLIAFGLYKEKQYDMSHSVVAISFFENICSGAGIIINGKIIHGRSNFAGEVSYLPLNPESARRIRLPIAKIENAEIIARTVCAFITILNPDVIMLCGSSISIAIMNSIAAYCGKIVPTQHIPELTYAKDTDSYYLSGLTEKALQCITRKVNS